MSISQTVTRWPMPNEVRFNGRTYGRYDQATHTIRPFMGSRHYVLHVEPETHVVRDPAGNMVGQLNPVGNIQPITR